MDISPVPCHDRGEAGAVWRQAKLLQYQAEACRLGLETDPYFISLAAKVSESTAALAELWRHQQEARTAPWWADGEYDDQGADRANDIGMDAFYGGRHSEAFNKYTEAIRLCPRKAAYHANRAAAALHLGRADIALEDARNAIKRNKSHIKAHLRAAAACMQLRSFTDAAAMYEAALRIDSACTTAKTGLGRAGHQAREAGAAAARQAQAALQGTRPAMSREAMDSEAAAQLLMAADAVLQASPDLESAKYARVEALIYCRRYQDALQAVPGLLPGPDCSSLHAEALWRSGSLAGALALLDEVPCSWPPSQKCQQLQQHLRRLTPKLTEAEAMHEDGLYQDCIEACTALMAALHPEACSGLSVRLLLCRARSFMARGLHENALADLQASLDLEPEWPDCLLLRAQVYDKMGMHDESFLDLQRLYACTPAMPGLFKKLQEGAARCTSGSSWAAAQGAAGVQTSSRAYATLGIAPASSMKDVHSAYRRLAARWHPDKWLAASAEEQQTAAARFESISEARNALSRMT